MKYLHTIIYILFFAMLPASCATVNNEFTIRGVVNDDNLIGHIVILTQYNNNGSVLIDSTIIADDATFSFSGSVADTCLAKIEIVQLASDARPVYYHFFLENSDISVCVKPSEFLGHNYWKFNVSGSKSDKRYRRDVRNCYNEYPGLMEESYNDNVRKCISKHPTTYYAPFLYYSVFFNTDDNLMFNKQMEAFAGDARNTYHYAIMSAARDIKSQLAIGEIIPNFELKDSSDALLKMLSFAQYKKYVLIDFWASWCGPCRREFSTIKEIYNRYSDNGFEVIGISIDEDPMRWKNALTEEDVPWVNVIGTNEIAKNVYGVQSIPDNFLIDNTGKIIASHLHGEDLMKKIDEIMR